VFATGLVAAFASGAASPPPGFSPAEIARWEREARTVTITRDDWGIAHVHGGTDADAVFGMEYAQAEDDFNRVETNYLQALGRMAEAEGESALFRDLRMKLFIDPDTLEALYRASPASLQKLMNAFADGLNYYLYKHPEVKPRVITRFEPWMALSFTEGSIGGDIERVDVRELAAFYGDSARSSPRGAGDGPGPRAGDGGPAVGDVDPLREPDGSNGIAIAPRMARDHHALLWINPHTSFYFRSELQMSSDEGLDTYGAVTWGQFFVYQGFNRTCGWMHTSSGVDNIDEFLETVTRRGSRHDYRYGSNQLPIRSRVVTIRYRTATGMAERKFTVYATQHGPIVRKLGEKWVSVSLMQRPIAALTQSFTRTKARDYTAFRAIMELHSNASNNTVFADSDGNIAYFHSNYIPRRDTSFDWTAPVDGSNPATSYHGLLSFDETPNCFNPLSGWLFNSNDWPWSAAGPNSIRRESFPRYVETGVEETPRGYHALRVLTGGSDWTMRSLTAAAFDGYLPSFARLIPRLLAAYDGVPPADPSRARLAGEIAALRAWDEYWGESSVPTALAVYWGESVVRRVSAAARAAHLSAQTYAATLAPPGDLLGALAAASDSLTAQFGTWKTAWGQINRFQRIDERIEPSFDDARPSIAVPFTSGIWGSLASFGARPYPGTKKWYGSYGNSFVAAVEFGDSVHAMAVTAGGASGHLGSPHFDDQAGRYASGSLRDVYFYPGQLKGHTERQYHPGE
jgi:acyl-homoserine-lactone acylase